MKLLPKELKKRGFYCKEVHREPDFAIYGVGNSKTVFIGYDVFEVKKTEEYQMAGNVIKAHESYPSDECFGVSAFFCKSLERANLRLQQLKDIKRLRYKNS